MNRRVSLPLFFAAGMALFSLTGCHLASYPTEKLVESLQEICRKEYGIEDVQIKIQGQTIGVYLPLERLFASDLKESVVAGKIRNLESLFEPSPEALDKVEDVLFSISRVLLSTDRDLKFYSLQATDRGTGLQLVFRGYVDDVKRVRIWDISRSEYRKRVIYEMRQNRALVWHAPVRALFRDMETLTAAEIKERYFSEEFGADIFETLFFDTLQDGSGSPMKTRWEIGTIRSARVQRGEILVYTAVTPFTEGVPLLPEGREARYLFMVSMRNEEPKITRVIPFQYMDSLGEFQEIPFPSTLNMEEVLSTWEDEFPVEDMSLGKFLANQLSRRFQYLLAADERIQNTFHEVKLNLGYEVGDEGDRYFSITFNSLLLRDLSQNAPDTFLGHEDTLYLMTLFFNEFTEVLRSYRFEDYDYALLDAGKGLPKKILEADLLDQFRRKKIDVRSLLGTGKI